MCPTDPIQVADTIKFCLRCKHKMDVRINTSILSNVLLNNNGMLARTEKQTDSWKLGFLSYFYESFLGHVLECRNSAVGFKGPVLQMLKL